MSNDIRPFRPLYTRSVEVAGVATAGTLQPSVTVAASAAATASTEFPGGSPATETQIQIANTTASWAYVNFGILRGGLTVTAATVTASYPIAPGSVAVVTVDPEINAASVILATGTGNVIFTRGSGT